MAIVWKKLPGRPIPVPTVDSADFWRAAADGRLCLPRCDACNQFLYPPAPRCPRCLSDALTWQDIPGLATLNEWTIVHLPGPQGLPSPFTVARASLDGAPEVLLIATLDPGIDPDAGMKLAVAFDVLEDAIGLPRFTAVA